MSDNKGTPLCQLAGIAAARLSVRPVSWMLLAVFALLVSCRPAPSEQTVRGTIASYFESRQYPVVELELGAIEPLSTREKTYMGVPAFRVRIKRIVLGIAREMPPGAGFQRGGFAVFEDAEILLKQRRDGDGGFVVSGVEGIALP